MRRRVDVAGVRALQRSAGNAATGAFLARYALLQRQPDEQKIKDRAYSIWESRVRTGQGGDAVSDYYEARRQIEIEERAHQVWEARPAGDAVANYYTAEHELANERAQANAAAAAVNAPQAAAVNPPQVAAVNPPQVAAVNPPQVAAVNPPQVAAVNPPQVAAVNPPQVAAVNPPQQAPARYVPPSARPGFVPMANAPSTAPPPLPPGYKSVNKLAALGFWSKQARHQLDVNNWHGFSCHLSVNPHQGAFNEFHVKFDLGDKHRVFYFFDVYGKVDWAKSSTRDTVEKALRADGCGPSDLDDAVQAMDDKARAWAKWLADRL